MTARVLRPAITFTTVAAVLVAALAVYAFLSAGAARADSVYSPTLNIRMCNALPPTAPVLPGTGELCTENLTAGAANDYTTITEWPASNTNFSNVVALSPNAPTVVAGNPLVGALRSFTNLGLTNNPCTTALLVDFFLYNVSLPNAATRVGMTNIAWPTAEGTSNRHANWRVGDGQHQFFPAAPLPTDNDWAPNSAAGTSTATSFTTLTDSSATWIPNHWVGHTVSTGVGAAERHATVASNTATELTLVVVLGNTWVDIIGPASTPPSGMAYTVTGTNITTANGVNADGTTKSIVNYPHHLLDLFDPDFVVGVGDGALEPKIPTAAYGGITLIAGTWIPLYFLAFPATGANSLSGGTALPAPLGEITTNMGFPSVTVLTDPSAAFGSPSTISDFCTPLKTISMLRSTVHTNPAAGTQMFVQYSASQRDTDQDGFENAIDTCPYTGGVGVEDPRNAIGVNDTGSDGIMDSCDTNGPYAGSLCITNNVDPCNDEDVDDDGFQNRQDNCPQVANTGQNEDEAGIPPPDKGPRTDGMGNECDGAQGGNPSGSGSITITQNGLSTTIALSDAVANGRYMSKSTHMAKCFKASPTFPEVDVDGDGYCVGGAAGIGGEAASTDNGACAVSATTLSSGTSTATSATTMTNSAATWVVDAFAGQGVTTDGKTGFIVSNTATVLTISAWTGGTPAPVLPYTISRSSCAVRHTLWSASPPFLGGTHPGAQQDADGDTVAADVGGPSNWSDVIESYLGTDPTKPCAASNTGNNESPMDNWPLDMDDNRLVNGTDYQKYNTVLNLANGGNRGINIGGNGDGTLTTPATVTVPGMGTVSQARFDLNMDGFLSGADQGKFNSYITDGLCDGVGGSLNNVPATLGGTYQQ